MTKRVRKRILQCGILLLLLAGLAALLFWWANAGEESYREKYDGFDLDSDVGDISREGTYTGYLRENEDAGYPECRVEVDLTAPAQMSGAAICTYEGRENVLLAQEESEVTYELDVPEDGWYRLRFLYCAVASRGIDAERAVLVNGESCFRGADTQTFCRLWTDDPAGKGKKDNQGNEIRPEQIEVLRWTEKYASDDSNGYVTEPYCFRFQKGKNTLTLRGVSEPLAIAELSLEPVTQKPDYAAYYAQYAALENNAAEYCQVIQGEEANVRSSPALYATYDHASPNTEPYSVSTVVLNITGGSSWSIHGQWIEWEAEVPADGWYNIAIKGRQNYNRGQSSVRTLYIDGQMPFAEAEQIAFQYSNDWQLCPLGDGSEDYCFYLTKGTHTLRLEVTLGEMGSVLSDLEDSVYRANQLYRQLLLVMGRNPDKYRDYNIDATYPDLADAMRLESRRLYRIADRVSEISGGRSGQTGTIAVLAQMMEDFADDTGLIKRRLSTYRDDISALGTTMQNLCQSQLDIDYLVIKSADQPWTQDTAGLADKTLHELRSFGSSFVTDYDTLGDVSDDAIEVWILTGRDQANILKTIIDDSFSPATGIHINLKLVDAGAVLSAVAAGNGPDLLLSAAAGEPVNYALRNAAEDLSQFDDCEEVLGRFQESSYEQYLYEGGIYALPETQYFNVLFYRRDILDELNLEVPQTWEDLEDMLPVLQHNNMEVGLPDIMAKAGANLSGFYAMLYQNGGMLYTDDGKRALLDSEAAVKAFEEYSAFYTNHDLPKDYNFADRFRSGEMPIGIADYTLQNTLAVFAPELKGLWDFALIPGTRQADGTVDHSVMSWGNCCMMLRNDDAEVKRQCWEFMKWWTNAETQARFGREMECLMGASARYATANLEAFQQLSWSSAQLRILNEQRSFAKANREVAGGYYTARHIVNAMRKVVNDHTAPRETLLDYNQTINEEIKKKRAEFDLD